MKKKTKVPTTGLKIHVMTIVGLMIVFLSLIFLFNISKYNQNEIQNVTDSYDRIINRIFSISARHIPRFYQEITASFLSAEGIRESFADVDKEKIYNATLHLFNTIKMRFAFLNAIRCYTSPNTIKVNVYGRENNIPFPDLVKNLLKKVVKEKKEYKSFWLSQGKLMYSLIMPVLSTDGTKDALGAIEIVLDPRSFLGDATEEMLKLNIVFLVRAGDKWLFKDPRMEKSEQPITEVNLINDNHGNDDLINILDKTGTDYFRKEVTYKDRIYMVHPHFNINDSENRLLAKVISILDITALKDNIHYSFIQVITVTVIILLAVFLILYYSFGKFMTRLVEREKQLGSINKELQMEILERGKMQEELKNHRDHLEELISEGTRELEIKSQEIETNEKKLRTITSSIQDAIVMLDHLGNILFWNPAAQRIYGYTSHELLGKDFFDYIIPADDHLKFAEILEKMIKVKGGDKESVGYNKIIEIECKRKNGEVFPAELMLSEVEIQGKSNLIALLRDITQKKIEETEKRILLRAVEQSSLGIEIYDTDGIIQYVNPKFTEITGFERDAVVGQKTSITKSYYSNGEDNQELWDTITSGKDWHRELLNRRKNGDLFWDSTVLSPIKDIDGKISHFLAIKEDITERKNMEMELLSAKESAEAASRSKGEFLANMSHEIRTPMNAIIGMTELTLGTELNEEQREYLDIVQQASRSLLKLLNDILDFSKVEAGKLILEPSAFSLRKILGETTKTLAVQAHKKDLELVYYIESDVPDQLVGDSGRLRQIIVNLIGNSIKFTENGEIVLKIEVLEEGFDGDKVLLHFTVSDTGIGISEDQLGTIFEKFSQVDSSTTRKYGGTGLGLAISSKLVELMGGIIWAESPSTFSHFNECGPGSTFHFTALFDMNKEIEDVRKQIELDKLKELSLLIVDDSETNRRFLQEVLIKNGLKPETAGSGEEALEILKTRMQIQTYFQLIILDYRMPGMDGRSVLKKIRDELNLDIPVILLTSGVKAEDFSELKSQQASTHLLKPINTQELLETILEVMGYKNRENGTRKVPDEEEEGGEIRESAVLRILVAEDNTVNQRLIRRLLEKKGHKVEIARDGKKAVEIFIKKAGNSQEKFQLILMDIQMPNMDGVEATREIRKIDKKIPIIALTAHAMKGDKGRFLSQGMDAYVSKPIDKSLLFKIIERYQPLESVKDQSSETQQW